MRQQNKNNRMSGGEETPGGKKKAEDIFGLARPKTGHKKKLE